jgi:uncharacterized protein YbjT (DUF2867 family)
MVDQKLFLVTGATGNTGDTTVRLLVERGHRVRAFVHREDDRSANLAAAGAEIVVGDLLDFEAVSSAMEGVDGATSATRSHPDCWRPPRSSHRPPPRQACGRWST